MKYRKGQIIKILGQCDPNLIGTCAKIRDILDEHYMLELLDHPCSYYPIWTVKIADVNSILHVPKTLLYGDKLCIK